MRACVCASLLRFKKKGSRIKDRLNRETENNVTILVNKVATDPEKAEVLGRGELQVNQTHKDTHMHTYAHGQMHALEYVEYTLK